MDFPFKIQIPDNRSLSDRSHGSPKDWWRKRPKVKNITRRRRRDEKMKTDRETKRRERENS
jgi:hypothetical protein